LPGEFVRGQLERCVEAVLEVLHLSASELTRERLRQTALWLEKAARTLVAFLYPICGGLEFELWFIRTSVIMLPEKKLPGPFFLLSKYCATLSGLGTYVISEPQPRQCGRRLVFRFYTITHGYIEKNTVLEVYIWRMKLL
jgi:hypothetical protein